MFLCFQCNVVCSYGCDKGKCQRISERRMAIDPGCICRNFTGKLRTRDMSVSCEYIK